MSDENRFSTMKQKLRLTSPVDGLVMSADLYVPEEPKAIIHIMHGMAEHKERYEELAIILSRLGCVVLVVDHRGLGERAS